jgi:hypothetical protein
MKTAATMAPAGNSSDAFASYLLWTLLALVLAMLVQAPASLLKKALPATLPVQVQAWGGTLWNGQADWQQGSLQGQLRWQLRPWQLLLGHASADIDLEGDVPLKGRLTVGAGGSWSAEDLSGTIPAELLRPVLPAGWDLPGSLRADKLSLSRAGLHKGNWRAGSGSLHWQGGAMTFDLNGQPASATLPPVMLGLKLEGDTVVLGLVEEAGQLSLAELRAGSDNMLETRVRQRLLAYSPSYHGQGSPDQIVVTAKQPL